MLSFPDRLPKPKVGPWLPSMPYWDVCEVSCAGHQTYGDHMEGQKPRKKQAAQRTGTQSSGGPTGAHSLHCRLVAHQASSHLRPGQQGLWVLISQAAPQLTSPCHPTDDRSFHPVCQHLSERGNWRSTVNRGGKLYRSRMSGDYGERVVFRPQLCAHTVSLDEGTAFGSQELVLPPGQP